MRLELLPLEKSDYDAYCTVCWEAFKDGIMCLMYPNGYTQAAREWTKQNLLKDSLKDSNVMNKVVDHDLPDDDANGKVVGIATWKIYEQERTEAELKAAEEEDDNGQPPDCNEALLEEFDNNLAKYKREILNGKPYVYLKILAVLPQYHRRGVGSMHLRSGIEKADELGLPSYLEASPMGTPLYAKMGYETVCEFDFDARKWGLGRDLPHVCMLRPGRMANGKP